MEVRSVANSLGVNASDQPPLGDVAKGATASSGYVLHTLEAALWAVDRTHSFSEAAVLAANLGGDADTVGAVTGQLAGALYGVGGMPQR